MTLSLPTPIQTYFHANGILDADAMLASFAADAMVRDEQRTHCGTKAIRAWIEQASIGNQAIATPLDLHSDGDIHIVTGRVAGAFPGSPVTLTFHFRLKADQIAELEIR